MPGGSKSDPLLRALEVGVAAIVILGPLPFGAVRDPGRAALELAAVALLAVWVLRCAVREVAIPPRIAVVPIVLLAVLPLVQIAPLGEGVVRALSPGTADIRDTVRPDPELAIAESELLDFETGAFDAGWTLSVSADTTADAARTGAALAALWIVAFAVAAEGKGRRVAFAILVSATVQATYGILVLASGHDRIWNVPKVWFLDCATGTFVNRNHFAHLVAVSATLGAGLLVSAWHRAREQGRGRRGWVAWFDTAAMPFWIAAGLLALTAAGLLLSFSRAGIAVGLAGIAAVLAVRGPGRRRSRLIAAGLLLVVAAIPLARIGPERLVARYADTVTHLAAETGRPTVWADTLDIGTAFPVVGAGFGTFADVYPSFRSPEIRLRFDHAHSDPLQLFAEGGLVAVVLLGWIAIVHVRAIRTAVPGRHGLAIGLAAATVVGAAHAVVDFPWHIPATAALDAIVAGLLVGTAWTDRT